MALAARLLTELVGTFIFLSVIALAGAAGPLAPLAVGVALVAMAYMGGHISGTHHNPAVSFGLLGPPDGEPSPGAPPPVLAPE